jgi:hypothetical protein
MFNIMRNGAAVVLGGAMVIYGAAAAYATPAVTTSTSITVGNDSDPSDPDGYLTAPAIDPHSSNTGAAISSQYSSSFTGLNSTGDSQTFSVDAGAKANAQFGQLKVSTKLHLDTPFANPANTPYVNSDYTFNTSGTPDYFSSEANATFQDTLSLTGAAGISRLDLLFHLDGTVPGNIANNAMAAGLFVTNMDTNERYYASYAQGAVDTDVVVSLDVTDPSAIDLAIQMRALSYAFLHSDPLGYDESQDYVVDSNFYDTLDLTGITAFDANGGQLALTGLTGISGTNYLALVAPPPSNNGVPEPLTLTLFGAGLLGLGAARRRRAH